MSKLIQRIERLGKDTPAPLGFGAATRRKAAPTMVLLASIADPKAAAKLEGISLDGVIYTSSGAKGANLAKASSSLKDVPWGTQMETATADQVKELVDAGCDFISLTGTTASLSALQSEDLGKFLVVAADIKEQHAHSLEVLPVDAVTFADVVSSPLNLDSLIALASVRGEIGCPFLIKVSGTLSSWELECLREIGIEGVIVDLESTHIDALTALAKVIAELPRRRSRSEMASPSLPRVSARAQAVEPDDDDDDDEYEGDDDSA
jgi:hypothetical protein